MFVVIEGKAVSCHTFSSKFLALLWAGSLKVSEGSGTGTPTVFKMDDNGEGHRLPVFFAVTSTLEEFVKRFGITRGFDHITRADPYGLGRVVRMLIEDHRREAPVWAEILRRNFVANGQAW